LIDAYLSGVSAQWLDAAHRVQRACFFANSTLRLPFPQFKFLLFFLRFFIFKKFQKHFFKMSQFQLLEFLKRRYEQKHRVSVERVVSGPGIANV